MQNKTRTVANFIDCNKPHILNQLKKESILTSEFYIETVIFLQLHIWLIWHFMKSIVNLDKLLNETSSGLSSGVDDCN